MLELNWSLIIIGMAQAFFNAVAIGLAGYLVASAIGRLGKKNGKDKEIK